MKTLIIDNFDSFTFNLYQYVGKLTGSEPIVIYNDEVNCDTVQNLHPDNIIISPGPGTPYKKRDRGNCCAVIRKYYKSIPILGICMGHQIIAYTFKAKINEHSEIFHGKTSKISIRESVLFRNINPGFDAMRYHSLVVDRMTLPSCFNVIAELGDGTIMGIELKGFNVYGLQFHPESIGTGVGLQILANFLFGAVLN